MSGWRVKGTGMWWLKNLSGKVLLGLMTLWGSGVVLAQTYPSRDVRIVVPYSPGGSSDVLARLVGAELQRVWGKSVAVDNRPGASGNIGTLEVVRSVSDGHTLLLQNDTMLTNLAVQGRLPYDHESDLTPIMLLGVTPLVLVAHPSTGITDVSSLVAAAKATPEGLSYGSCGIGSPAHFVMELIKHKTGIEAVQVGYRGCSPAVVDVMGGQIPLAAVSANLVVSHVKAGRLLAVGVSSAKRYDALPDVPTLEEQGLQPFDLATWKALMGPARLPLSVVNRIHSDVAAILDDPVVKAVLAQAGVDPLRGNGSDLARVIRADALRYRELAQMANIRPQ